MRKTASRKHLRWIVLAILLLPVLTGCLAPGIKPDGLQASVTGNPPYTPVVSIPEGTTMPTEAKLITIEQFVADPASYLGEFIEIHGYNAGVYQLPQCSPYFGPPTTWVLTAEPHIIENQIQISNPPTIEIKNPFDYIISHTWDENGSMVSNPLNKLVAIWGWVRLYDGIVGCRPTDVKKVWYIDVVQLQFLERIEVNRTDK